MIQSSFTVRGQSDYDDFYLVSKSDVEAQTANAKIFYNAVCLHIDSI
jgi:hypothetical protein